MKYKSKTSQITESWLKCTTPIQVLTAKQASEQTEYPNLKSIASESRNDPNKQMDLMYIDFILCHEGHNDNGDYFFKDELENAYYSIVNKVYDWEHDLPIIGFVSDAELVKPSEDAADPRWHVRCAGIVWKWKFADYAQAIKDGAKNGKRRNSMECYFTDYVYVLGSPDNIVTRAEEDLDAYINKSYNGVPVYRGIKGLTFGGVGCVGNPADKDAVFKSVATKMVEEVPLVKTFDITKFNSLEELEKEVGCMNGEVRDADTQEVDSVASEGAEVKDEDVKPVEAAEVQADEADKVDDDNNGESTVDANATDEPTDEPATEGSADEANEEPDATEAQDESADENSEDVAATDADEADAEGQGDDESAADVADATDDEPEDTETDASCDDPGEQGESQAMVGVDEILEKWSKEHDFWNTFRALEIAIESVLFDDEVANKQESISKQINVFATRVFGLLPAILDMYGLSNVEVTSATLKSDLESAQTKIQELESQLSALQSEYDAYKQSIDAEKQEVELNKLAELRVKDLLEAGLKFSDNRIASIKEKVKYQTEEEFLDFKNLLVEARYTMANAGQKDDTQEIIKTKASLDGVNMESEKPKTLVDVFGNLIANKSKTSKF